MSQASQTLVYCEDVNLMCELIGAAAAIRPPVAVLVTSPAAAQRAAEAGADLIYRVDAIPAGYLCEDVLPTLAQMVRDSAFNVVLIGSTARGRLVAGRLAAQLNTSALTDVKSFSLDGGSLTIRHMIFGGGAERVERSLSPTVILTMAAGIFDAPPVQPGRQAEMIPLVFIPPEKRVALRERKALPPASVNLAAAKRVVCPGRGIAKQEDLAMVEDLARALGAEVACTRPLSEGLGWLPRERYIGISGAHIKSDLYLGLGVSGQVQHTVGITGSRIVVAVNRDANAPIFEQADYGIAADLYTVVPALLQALRGH
ncbi:MAG: electron transfer flavoprotein subunit alpha/FixB family protein [Chloroflexota bacterium]